MKKVRLEVEERLVYIREIDVMIPDDMDETGLEMALQNSESSADSLDDFIWGLRKDGITCDGWDDSMDSPLDVEVECDGYDFIDDSEED
ncbi:hypothetical protein [Paenibacillus rhizolycopersici]|uniref:hypothetical protein n=1 Tax=Paenibacillus rhizolycopersici TaxID=2780073 RepID=UPI003D2822F1